VLRNLFKAGLNNFISFERLFILGGRWLNNFKPEKEAPFWDRIKLHTGRCKFMLDLVLMLWISWLVEYKSLFFTTNNSTENLYLDSKSRIFSPLNNCLQESLLPYFVVIQIISFWTLKLSVLCGKFPQKIIPYVIIKCTYE
jgi:hypothetical protein